MKFFFILKCSIIILWTLSIISFFSKPPVEDHTKNHGYSWEEYDPSFFFKFKNVNDLIADADQHFNPAERNKMDYFNHIAQLMRKRFYHGYSYYNLSDNPLAFLSGKIYSHLSAIVIPDDIMRHPMAACSQQSIVLMEIFKRCGVNYRKVGFDHHYAVEANIDGIWLYFDTDIAPKILERASIESLISSGRFDSVYREKLSTNEIRQFETKISYGKINATPAPRAKLFHKLCYLLVSKYFLIPSLFVIIFLSMPIGAFYLNRINRAYSLSKIPVKKTDGLK